MSRITVLGAGTWGLGISILLKNNGHEVKVWSAVGAEIDSLVQTGRHVNLPDVDIPDGIVYQKDIDEALADAEILVMAVASVYVRRTAALIAAKVKPGTIIVNLAKGIEEETLLFPREQIAEEIPQAEAAVLSGPSHAEEVSRGLPTNCVVGAESRQTAEYLQEIFMSPVFRVYTSPDITGIELGGSIKNVIALAAGMADGLGYGDNTKAALITRGMAEIARLGRAMGASEKTLYGLSGIGDLIVTCASMHSRNRRAGILIGQGYSMEDAMEKVNMVVEGVYSAKAALALSRKHQVEMPIVTEVNKILFSGKNAGQAVEDLMIRYKKPEHGELPWTRE